MALSKPNVADVRLIVATGASDSAVSAVIDDATLFAEGCPVISSYSTDRQAAIIKYITAHMLLSSGQAEGQKTAKALGDASESYASPTLGSGLGGSSYGQMAITLDPSGCLSNLGKVRAGFTVVSRRAGCR